MKILLSGNEAIARGIYDAGCRFAAAYPGTPSTEIMENYARFPDVHAEWTPNEKVALEVAVGASFAGARAIASMKHVGLNVAADPFFTLSYTGVRGGLIIFSCDDPGLHSSQNEQDNRNYAAFAKVPMLEPSDSQEAYDFVRIAFEISEKFDTPVILRTTTRISHVKSVLELRDPLLIEQKLNLEKDPQKLVMLPAFARRRHVAVEERLQKLQEHAETFEGNYIIEGSKKLGIISSSVAYSHAREVAPDASFLKLGFSYPFPDKLIRKFAAGVERLVVVEELDPFIENHLKTMGLEVEGKSLFPMCDELTPDIISCGLEGGDAPTCQPPYPLPPRPPILCSGCPHRAIFSILGKEKIFITGDIGCYTLAAPPPLSALDTCLCMGAGIGQAHGIDRAFPEEARGKVVAVIGDSTFNHSGITGLMNIAYNKGTTCVFLLDNSTTAMTGRQQHPGTGRTLQLAETCQVDYEALARAVGIKRVRTLDPADYEGMKKVVREEIAADEASFVIVRSPCMLIPESKKTRKAPMVNIVDRCTGCRKCLEIACPSISWLAGDAEYTSLKGKKKKRKGRSVIDPLTCTGCGVCLAVCKFEAIEHQPVEE
jgi:indolepyruvate ferredoxin oxidoreductase, alpha subunit